MDHMYFRIKGTLELVKGIKKAGHVKNEHPSAAGPSSF
jgi:hypothetical protein